MLKIAAIFQSKTGLPEDATQNSFHFAETGDGTASDAQLLALRTAVKNFYDSYSSPGLHAVGYYLGASVSRATGALNLKAWDVDGSTGVETFRNDFTTTLGTAAAAGASLPSEVAGVLTLTGYTPGASALVKRSERGRIYIGPLGSIATSTDGTTGESYLTPEFIADVEDAAKKFKTAVDAVTGWGWVVYSKTHGTFIPITAAWMDNAPDIQRRRGVKATTRNAFTFA